MPGLDTFAETPAPPVVLPVIIYILDEYLSQFLISDSTLPVPPVIEDEVEVEVEEVKPTETKIVDDWDDDDFNFDLDDTKKDDHGGEFFL